MDVSTCLTPTHSVYSVELQRYLLPTEHLSLQGIWRQDSENHQAFDTMAENGKLARDLAGNSFSGTVAQAAVISCLVTCDAWRHVGVKSPLRSPGKNEISSPMPAAKRRRQSCQNRGEGASSAREAEAMVAPSHQKNGSNPNSGDPAPHESAVPNRRLRRKTAVTLAPPPGKRHRNNQNTKYAGNGNKSATGKKKMATLAQKEKIMATYREAQARGDPKAYSLVKKMQGFFHGCVYPSKWGKIRDAQSWNVFLAAAPQLCNKVHEFPQPFRQILKMKNRRQSQRRPTDQAMFHLPVPFQEVVEEHILERIGLGEEVQLPYVRNVLRMLVDTWNTSVLWLRLHGLNQGRSVGGRSLLVNSYLRTLYTYIHIYNNLMFPAYLAIHTYIHTYIHIYIDYVLFC